MHDNFATAWFDLLNRIYTTGEIVAPRGQATRELIGVQVSVSDMLRNVLVHPMRNLNYRFMVAEWLWMAAGRGDVAAIAKYNKNIAQFSDDGMTFAGAYGPRIAAQLPWAIEQLSKPGSRQAIVQIWSPVPSPSKDIPCTLSWQILVRKDKLHAIVTMRSSDIWLGLPYDFFNFSQLTNGIAGEFGLQPGSLTFNLGSSHLYERNLQDAELVLNNREDLRCVQSPRLPFMAPADDILTGAGMLMEPWSIYSDALNAKTRADALTSLEVLSE